MIDAVATIVAPKLIESTPTGSSGAGQGDSAPACGSRRRT